MAYVKYESGAQRSNSAGIRYISALSLLAVPVLALLLPNNARAAGASAYSVKTGSKIEEVVVTAEKRKEDANKVPMSITAIDGGHLRALGIFQPKDLGTVVPGFSYADSYVGSPIYTIRGIGFSDISLGGRPTVSIYSDQVPIPFAIETLGASLDLARVEVLMGPQGTLFGQNATGGAINYIAAKPTDVTTAGLDVSYGNYNAIDINGFISGPLSDTVNARLAFEHSQNGDWQQSYTSGARTGARNFNNGRLILAWKPSTRLSVQLTVNGWVDGSDTQAAQLLAITPSSPLAALVPGLLAYPLAPQTARAADFNPGLNYHKNNNFFQSSIRADYFLSGGLKLTSLSSYSEYHEHQLQDIDGTALSNLSEHTNGNISSFYQELRISRTLKSGTAFVLGVDYASDRVYQSNITSFPQSSTAQTFVPLGLPLFSDFRNFGTQREDSYAAFGNIDYQLTPTLQLSGGARFTQANNSFSGCSADSGDGVAASDFGPFQNYVRLTLGLPPNPPIPAGGCITANSAFEPGLVTRKLDENNFSWRTGLAWSPSDHTLLYANVSKGYKAGGFPDLGATTAVQYDPAKQESVLAYEAGFKSALADHSIEVNGAVFYYDYSDKQILGRVLDPLFGPLLKLVNVPKSEVRGAELQVTWLPLDGLDITAGASYVDSKVLNDFTNYNSNGVIQNFNGESFPNAPTWQLTGSMSYEHPISADYLAFMGANVSYRTKSNSELGNLPLLALREYAMLDFRAGIESADGAWRFTLWARNLTDQYYWTAASRNTDTTTRFAGMPRTYGISISYRFNPGEKSIALKHRCDQKFEIALSYGSS